MKLPRYLGKIRMGGEEQLCQRNRAALKPRRCSDALWKQYDIEANSKVRIFRRKYRLKQRNDALYDNDPYECIL